MPKVYLVSREDFRGLLPVKVFALKENAKFFKGECDVALKLITQSENPEIEFELLKSVDNEAIWCENISYSVEEIQTE